jgi:hypothetical protein
MMSSGFWTWTIFSSSGRMSAIAEILRSVTRMNGSFSSAIMRSESVTMYGEM